MKTVMRLAITSVVVAGATAALIAQGGPRGPMDLSGEWAPLFHEDQPERIPGPDIGDYLGLPITDAARQKVTEASYGGRLAGLREACRVKRLLERQPTHRAVEPRCGVRQQRHSGRQAPLLRGDGRHAYLFKLLQAAGYLAQPSKSA